MNGPDEKAIERDFCAGVLSLQAVADKHGITIKALRYMAEKKRWERAKGARAKKGQSQGQKAGAKKEFAPTKIAPKKTEEKDDSEVSDDDTELSIDPDEYGISLQQASFAHYFVKTRCRVTAYQKADYKCEGKAVYAAASQIYRNIKVQRAIRDLEKRVAKRYQFEFDDLVNQLVAIINADPSALSQYRRVNCRYCWGENHFYQWRDIEEFDKADAKAAADGNPKPEYGGLGFVTNADPNPDCPRCNGEGIGETFFAETRDLEGDERYLYAGVKESKFGIEILMEDKKTARKQLIQILNMQQSKVANGNRPAVNNYSPEDYRAAVRSLNDEFEDLD